MGDLLSNGKESTDVPGVFFASGASASSSVHNPNTECFHDHDGADKYPGPTLQAL
jgi:hypothetical protein